MHFFTYAAALVLAAVVAASPTHLIGADSVARLAVRSPSDETVNGKENRVDMMCFGGCPGGGGLPFNPNAGFAQPLIFTSGITSIQTFTTTMTTFATACSSTVNMWQGIQSFQIIQQQFQMMIVSMSSLIASFQGGCGFCMQTQGPIFIQTITQVIIQVQSMVTFIFTQYGSQIAVFQNEFSALAVFFQTIIGIGMSMGVNMQQVFTSCQFNFQMFQTCGIPVQQWCNGGQSTQFFFQQTGLIGQILGPVVQLLDPVVHGLSDLLGSIGFGLSNLLGGGQGGAGAVGFI